MKDMNPDRPVATTEEPPPLLRARQLECLAWAREGKSAGDIGTILGLSPRTVEEHLANACALLGVRTRLQAILRAQALGVFDDASAAAPEQRSFGQENQPSADDPDRR